jgi:fluoroquinolone resistance protein
MKRVYEEDKTFDTKDYTAHGLPVGEYEGCRFTDCNFSGVDLSGIQFFDCVFNNCNMSNAIMKQTVLREVKLNNCKLLGIRFDECNAFLFSPQFENCVLRYASFYKLKMKATNFINCNAGEVDFTEADLSHASFSGTDLALAQFDATNLENADLRTAFNYNINPSTSNLKKAKFSWPGLMGLLGHLGIEVE